MKKILLIIVGLLCLNSMLNAQPPYPITQKPQEGKKARYYISKAKAALKKDQLYWGIANATYALRLEIKKKQRKDLYKLLESHYQRFIRQHTHAIDHFSLSLNELTTDKEVNQLATHCLRLQELILIQQYLAKAKPSNLQQMGLQANRSDYASQLAKAKSNLAKAESLMKDKHYKTAKIMMDSTGSIYWFRKIVRIFDLVQRYDPNYLDTKELRKVALKKGMTRLSILHFERTDRLMIDPMAKSGLEHAIYHQLYQHTKSNPFWELWSCEGGMILYEDLADYNHKLNRINRQRDEDKEVHYQLQGTIKRIDEQKQAGRDDPYTDSAVISIGKPSNGKDNKVKVNAKVTRHWESIHTIIKVSYRIVNRKTGEVIIQHQLSENFEWGQSWGSFTGEKKALSKVSKALIARKREQRPLPAILLKECASKLATQLAQNAHQFMVRQDL